MRAEDALLVQLRELLLDALVGVKLVAVAHAGPAGDGLASPHAAHSRMSTKCPAMAAAAAICGDTRGERAPRPWRPSKLRFEVEATRSPGAATSGFMPRHIEQPALRHSNPARLKTSSSPSRSAWALTCWDPGTTIA